MRQAGAPREPEDQDRHLRGARRRPGEHLLLPRGRARLRQLQPLPHTGGAPRGGEDSHTEREKVTPESINKKQPIHSTNCFV